MAEENPPPQTPDLGVYMEEGLRAWRHGAEMTVRYWQALGRARSPQDIIAANADFFSDGAGRFLARDDAPHEGLSQPFPD